MEQTIKECDHSVVESLYEEMASVVNIKDTFEVSERSILQENLNNLLKQNTQTGHAASNEKTNEGSLTDAEVMPPLPHHPIFVRNIGAVDENTVYTRPTRKDLPRQQSCQRPPPPTNTEFLPQKSAPTFTVVVTTKTDVVTMKTEIVTTKPDVVTTKTNIVTTKTETVTTITYMTTQTGVVSTKNNVVTKKTDVTTINEIATKKTDMTTKIDELTFTDVITTESNTTTTEIDVTTETEVMTTKQDFATMKADVTTKKSDIATSDTDDAPTTPVSDEDGLSLVAATRQRRCNCIKRDTQ
ncbi:hypothetical protein O0L34_g2288 [Tuta absoluta]|nr:hypothetical protein O0L34_g2288 [Tuta absoluta]